MNDRGRWMYGDRHTSDFIVGLHKFIDVAKAKTKNGFICCPCVYCRNIKEYSSDKILHGHLLQRGFMPSYIFWTKHGERGVMMEDNGEEENDENYPMFPEYGDSAADQDNEDEVGDEDRASDEPADDPHPVISDAK